jgi:hypothetical protein
MIIFILHAIQFNSTNLNNNTSHNKKKALYNF